MWEVITAHHRSGYGPSCSNLGGSDNLFITFTNFLSSVVCVRTTPVTSAANVMLCGGVMGCYHKKTVKFWRGGDAQVLGDGGGM